MSNSSENNSGRKEMWGCIGAVGAALITGIIALIIAGKIPFSSSPPTATPLLNKIDAISGTWVGTAKGTSKDGDYEIEATFIIGNSCSIGTVCGTFDIPTIPCSGTVTITKIDSEKFEFQANDLKGACVIPATKEFLQLLPDGTLLYDSIGNDFEARGILRKVK
jgi:hypothetical protein